MDNKDGASPPNTTTISPNPKAWVGMGGEILEWVCDTCREPGIRGRARFCHGCGLKLKR